MKAALPLATRVRLLAFQALEKISDLRGNAAAASLLTLPPAPDRPAWWVFASTIGELNAVAPLLDAVAEQLPDLAMVLITDHAHYRDSYAARYPRAEIVVSLGHSRDAEALAKLRPPRLVMLAEIPLLPSDAPCRCSAAFLLIARRRGAQLVAVNGWLYGYQPACRMDRIERGWLTRALLEQFACICVQTEEIRERLKAAGAPPAAIHVTGNLKIDVLRQEKSWQPADARYPVLMQSLADGKRLIVVAGSLTREDELVMVLNAYVALREQHPCALLVLAPRHPEVPANLRSIEEQLAQHSLNCAWRSRLMAQTVDDEASVLILDTIGELRDLYAVCTVAHVGTDHNVLEPLAYGKPTTVTAGWEVSFPSYPVYRALIESGSLLTASNAPELARHWAAATGETSSMTTYRVRSELTHASNSALAQQLLVLAPSIAPASLLAV